MFAGNTKRTVKIMHIPIPKCPWHKLILPCLLFGMPGASIAAEDQFLDLIVPKIELKNVTLTEALQELKKYGLRVGLELKPARRNDETKRFTISRSGVSLATILDDVTRKAEGYTWVVVKRSYPTGMVHVFPIDPNNRFDTIMNLRVAHIEIKGDVDPRNAINQIGNRVPELAKLIGGSAGSYATIRGDEFCLELSNISLRELLNEISLQRRDLGWLFRPILDESAPTGVYYNWSAL